MEQNKENGKRLVKITKEQYNRIFASKAINEIATPKMPVVKGGLTRVDKSMAKALPVGSVKTLEEEKPFDIKKSAPGIPKSAQGKFKEPVMEGEEKVQGKVIEFIHYLYGETKDFPQFKNPQGGVLTFDEITDELLAKKLIVKKDGRFKLSKSSGSPEQAKQAIEDELNAMTGTSNMELETENYPAGAEHDPNAPWNQEDDYKDDEEEEKEKEEENFAEINGSLKTIGSNYEISILTDGKNYFVFLYGDLSEKPLSSEFVTNFAAKHKNEVGYGLNAWDSGKFRLIQIDEPLKQDLLDVYDKDQAIFNALDFPLNEDDAIDAYHKFKANTSAAMTPKKGLEKTPEEQNAMVAKLKAIRDAELAKREIEKTQSLEETTGTGGGDGSIGSSTTGQYTGSAGLFSDDPLVKKKIARVGQTKVPVVKEGSEAHTKTQWSGGGFVEFNDCVDLNNKPAGAGCSAGAVDNVVSVKKTKGNVNAPSLSENQIYEAIAKKTGKTIDEIKSIIVAKNTKA
jgi:hypothetical protein